MNRQQWAAVGGVGLVAGLGAGLMYLLDPQSGHQRRTAVRDKTVSTLKKGGTAVSQTSRHLAGSAFSAVGLSGLAGKLNGKSHPQLEAGNGQSEPLKSSLQEGSYQPVQV